MEIFLWTQRVRTFTGNGLNGILMEVFVAKSKQLNLSNFVSISAILC